MARQDNPFALLGEDDDGADVSVLLAKVEAKISMLPVPVPEQPKQKTGTDGFPSKPSPPSEYVRGERSQRRGSRGRGLGRGGHGNVGGGNAIELPENGYARGYGSGEYKGGRGHGRAGRGRGRGRGFGSFGENQLDCENLGEGGDREAESHDKGYYGQRRPFGSESRKFGDDNQGKNGEEMENHGFRAYGFDRQNQEGRDGEIRERSYGGDWENRGFRGGEARGRGYGGRGWRGWRDGGRVGSQYESNEGWNASENKEVAADEIEQTVNDTNTGDVSTRWDSSIATEEPKVLQSEKPVLEQKASEAASKVPEEEDNEMTLAEYEKVLQEKRKALESLKIEARKVVLDKEFEGMQLMEKKKEEDLSTRKSDKDKGKKKEIAEKEEKSRKLLSINEFLKPADGERFRAPASSRGRGGRGRGGGGYRGNYPSQAAPAIEDPGQFPILGAVAKA